MKNKTRLTVYCKPIYKSMIKDTKMHVKAEYNTV